MANLVDATRGVVRFRMADGGLFEVPLPEMRSEDLARSSPWRTFRWRRGQRHYSGLWWSSTMRAHVSYESRLELARLILADFDSSVRAIVSQPFVVEADRDGRVRRHVPDFVLVDGDGQVRVVNVKPSERLCRPEVAAALAWAHELFEARGWRTEVWSGAEPTFLANVRFLAGFRRPGLFDPELLEVIEGLVWTGAAVAEVEGAFVGRWLPVQVRPVVLHLLWTGRLRTDLSEPLSSSSRLVAA